MRRECKVSELINKLQQVIKAHGDVRVVVPGFDENGFEDAAVSDVETFYIDSVDPIGHQPPYEKLDEDSLDDAEGKPTFRAVCVDFS